MPGRAKLSMEWGLHPAARARAGLELDSAPAPASASGTDVLERNPRTYEHFVPTLDLYPVQTDRHSRRRLLMLRCDADSRQPPSLSPRVPVLGT